MFYCNSAVIVTLTLYGIWIHMKLEPTSYLVVILNFKMTVQHVNNPAYLRIHLRKNTKIVTHRLCDI